MCDINLIYILTYLCFLQRVPSLVMLFFSLLIYDWTCGWPPDDTRSNTLYFGRNDNDNGKPNSFEATRLCWNKALVHSDRNTCTRNLFWRVNRAFALYYLHFAPKRCQLESNGSGLKGFNHCAAVAADESEAYSALKWLGSYFCDRQKMSHADDGGVDAHKTREMHRRSFNTNNFWLPQPFYLLPSLRLDEWRFLWSVPALYCSSANIQLIATANFFVFALPPPLIISPPPCLNLFLSLLGALA